jgi:hypothetical protein
MAGLIVTDDRGLWQLSGCDHRWITDVVASTNPAASSTTATTAEAATTSSYRPPSCHWHQRRRAGWSGTDRYQIRRSGESYDLEGLAALLTDEFVFNEPRTVNASKEAYLAIMEPYIANPDWDSGQVDLRFLVGGDEYLEAYQTWGFGGATEESPLVEVDLIVVRDGEITSIVSMYGVDMFRQFGGIILTELMDAYVTGWSSGDPGQVEALYAETAVRVEALYGVELEGSTEIARYATGFFQRHGDAVLRIVEPFVFGRGGDTWDPNVGAVFSLVDAAGCSVEFAVLLEGDASGAVTSERVYYNLDTIQACDWQR